MSLLLALLLLTGCKNFYLTGNFDRQGFVEQCRWKKPVATKYRPDAAYLDSLQTVAPFDARVFVGTWCSDSRRWVPRFLSIAGSIPLRKLEFIAVDTTKRDAEGLYRLYAVDSVPTFVFLRDGQVVGKLATKPYKKRLEKELYRLLK